MTLAALNPRIVLDKTAIAAVVVAVLIGAGAAGDHAGAQADEPHAYRYAATTGTTDVPWPRSSAFLNHPAGVATDDEGVWVANAAALTALRFGSGPVYEIGRAGDRDALRNAQYDAPLGWIADLAPQSPSGALPTPTPDPLAPPPPPPARTVWLVDRDAHVVLGVRAEFDGQTTVTTVIGEPGAPGDGESELRMPIGVAHADGMLYISDSGNHRVQVFTEDGVWVSTLGTGRPGAGDDAFSTPGRLAVGADGRLYVADTGNARVQAFELGDPADPQLVRTYDHAELQSPVGVTADRAFIYVADADGQVDILRRDDGSLWNTLDGHLVEDCGSGDPDRRWRTVTDVALDREGHIVVALPDRSQVVVCHARSHETHRGYGTYEVPYPVDLGHHFAPSGVGMKPDGTVVVVEGLGHRVVGIPGDGSARWSFGQSGRPGADDDRLDTPSDVELAPDGRALIADRGNGRIVVLSPSGVWSGSIGEGVLDGPEGLAMLEDGRIAVADAGRQRVVIFDASGNHVGDLADATGPIKFQRPADVDVDAAGRWYVADRGEHVVRVFDDVGASVRVIGTAGTPGDGFDAFRAPRGLDIDPQGRLVVADTGNHRVLVYDNDGDFVTTIGGATGRSNGMLSRPRGVATATDGGLLVADTDNHRVQHFAAATPPWQPGARDGFGARDTVAITSLADFGGHLYSGLRRDADGALLTRSDGLGDAEPAAANISGADQGAVVALEVLEGQLYAGTSGVALRRDRGTGDRVLEQVRPGQLWRSPDGERWEAVTRDGFGEPDNVAVASLAGFDGHVYAGTTSDVDADDRNPHLWRSEDGAPGSWEREPLELFSRGEWERNHAVSALGVFSNTLYLGTCGYDQAQLWSSADGTRWRAVGYLEPGGDPRFADPELGSGGPACVTSLEAYEDRLYVGLGHDPEPAGRWWDYRPGPVEILRCRACDGTDWEGAASAGFGNRFNTGRVVLLPFDEPPFSYLYAAVGNGNTGLEVWRAADGLDWEPVASGGFGDGLNVDAGGLDALASFRERLFVGTHNPDGAGELWWTAGLRPGVVPTAQRPTPTATPRPRPEPPTGRARYTKRDEWPSEAVAPDDVLGDVVDMAVADDGTVFLADRSTHRVSRFLPSESWGRPFGGTGSGPDRVAEPGSIAVDSAAGRVYVGDVATERIVVYDLDGNYLESFPEWYAVDIHVDSDGSLWVADHLVTGVAHLAPDGTLLERVGTYSADDDFGVEGLVQVARGTDGRLWIADLMGARVRGYEQAGGAWRRMKTVNLGSAQYARTGCDGARLQPLPGGHLLATACVLDSDGRYVEALPANHRGSDVLNVGMRTANAAAGRYFALATYDTEPLDFTNETWPALVRYVDDGFDIVSRVWRAEEFDQITAASGAVLDPQRLSLAPDGSLYLSDEFGLRRFDADGNALERLPTTLYPSRHEMLTLEPHLVVGTGERGRVAGLGVRIYGSPRRRTRTPVVLYADGRERRFCEGGRCERDIYLEEIWMSSIPRLTHFNFAVAHEPSVDQLVVLQLFSDNPSNLEYPARLLLYPLGQRGRKTELPLEGADRDALWTDVDVGPDHRIHVLDSLRDRIQTFAPDGTDLGMISTPKDSWRLAGGPNGEVFVLTTYGHVVRIAADGTELSRFVGMPNDFTPPTALVDLAVDASGRVFVTDDIYDQVTVFEPEGTEDEVLQGAACSIRGDKWVDPTDILLGDAAELVLTLFGTCGFVEQDADIVLAVNAIQRANIGNLRVARQLLSLIDLDRHRAAIVGFGMDSEIEEPLTHDTNDLVRSLYNMNYGRIPFGLAACRTNHLAGLQAARDALGPPSDRMQVIILIDPGAELAPGECPWDRDRVSAYAEQLRADGVRVVAVNRPSIAATSELFSDLPVAQRGTGTGRPALRRAVSRSWPSHLVERATLTDRLPDNIDYVPGSASPPATWDAQARTLTWSLADLALEATHRFTLRIRPREEGRHPTNVEASAEGDDGWGNPFRVELPVPYIRVYGELPPSPTPTPTVTPTPEPTPIPEPIYLPIALKVAACAPETQSADVVLVLDTSTSMSERTRADGPTKLEAAIGAAREFVGLMVAGRDQAAVVQFNSAATLVQELIDDPAVVETALGGLTQQSGTRIDLGLDAARDELESARRRTTNNAVVVLLTDGEPTGTTPEDVRAAADRARSAGLLVFTIGLGGDVDAELLRDVATRPAWYFPAPDTADLAAIYRRIAFEIPCEPAWP